MPIPCNFFFLDYIWHHWVFLSEFLVCCWWIEFIIKDEIFGYLICFFFKIFIWTGEFWGFSCLPRWNLSSFLRSLCKWNQEKIFSLNFIWVFLFIVGRAAAIPRDYGGDYIQMRLSYSPFAPLVLFLIEWMDYRCTDTLPSCLGLLNILVYKVGKCKFKIFLIWLAI